MERLVIAWSPERSDCDWMLLDQNGNRQGPVTREAPLDAVPGGAGREVVWIVPGMRVVSVRAELPVKGRERILRALPYALEERFAEDPDALFFALAPLQPGKPVQAAAVDREWFEGALATLAGHGLAADRAVPDYLALPRGPGEWTALADAGLLYVRQGDGLGFALETDIGWPVLQRRLAALEEGERPQAIRFVRGREPWGAVPGMESLAADPEPVAEGLLGVVTEGLAGGAAQLDLLQGSFGRRQAWQPVLRPWLPVGYALAAVAVLALTGFVANWVHLAHANTALRTEIRTRFHQVLPGATWIDESTARAQVTQRLQQGAAGSGQTDLLSLLADLAHADTASVDIQSLTYQGGSLQVQVHAPQVSTLDALRTAVSRDGLSARLRSANQTKSGVDGSLVISGAAP